MTKFLLLSLVPTIGFLVVFSSSYALAQNSAPVVVEEILLTETPPAEAEMPVSSQPGSTKAKIENKYKEWSQKVFDTAFRLDSFFGEDRAEEEITKTWVRVRTDLHYKSGDGLELKPRIRAKVVLPNLKKKLQLVFSSDDEDQKEGETTRHAGEETSRASAALRYLFRDTEDYKFDIDAGVRTKSGGVRTFARARFRKNFTTGTNTNGQLSNKLYWYTDSGWENEGRLDYEKELNDDWFTRSTSKLSWFEEKEGVFGEQTFTAIHEISPKKTLAFDSITYLKSDPQADEKQFNETLVQMRYRQNYLWDWFYIEARPILAFPSNEDYDLEWRAMLRGEVVFGDFANY